MKNIKIVLLISTLLFILPTYGQNPLLRKLGKKLEEKIENRIENKVDQIIEKNLDKLESQGDRAASKVLDSQATNISKESKPMTLSNSAKTAITKLTLEDIAVNKSSSLNISGGDCASFNWFKKGSSFEYLTTSPNNKEEDFSQKMNIVNIRQEGNKTIAEIAGSSNHNGETIDVTLHYICDGDQIYVDLGNMMEAMIKQNPDLAKVIDTESIDKLAIDINNGFTSYPSLIYQGQKLDDAHFSFKTSMGGMMSIDFGVHAVERVVVGKESITTQAGTFDCMKIRSVTVSQINMMGTNQNMPPQIDYVWFAPRVGMVKQESYDDKQKLLSTTELTLFKN